MCPEHNNKAVKGLEHKFHGVAERTGILRSGGEEHRGGLIALYNSLKGCCADAGVSLYSCVTSNRMRGNGFKLNPGRVRLDTRKNFFSERVTVQ